MYLKKAYSISPQPTFDNRFENGEVAVHEARVYSAIEPNYLDFIPATLLRRMGKAVKMGIGAGIPLIQGNKDIKGIIVGTANGGLENCINFLNQIVDYKEGTLTPTNFVQSTTNAVAGQLALLSENTGYNMTHVNGALSFENALVDGMLHLETCMDTTDILIGAVEEISDYNYNIDFLAKRYKSEIVANTMLLETHTAGSVCGEGSSMFICSNSKKDAVAEILEVVTLTYPEKTDVLATLDAMLKKHNIGREDVDIAILGYSGDNRTDFWYDEFKREFSPKACFTTFKNLVGEYRTVSSFALYMAFQFLSGSCKNLLYNNINSNKGPKIILIYNHFDGVRHSISILRKVDGEIILI